MDKAEGKRKIDAIPEIFGSSKKARIDKPVQIEPIQSVAEIEAEKVAETEIGSGTENISEADTEIVSEAETEVFVETDDEKEFNSGDTVQIEPIQSEAGETVDKPETETVAEVASQFEPVQTDDAPMIEALDDLDIDWTESEDEAEPEPVQNTVEEVPDDLDQSQAEKKCLCQAEDYLAQAFCLTGELLRSRDHCQASIKILEKLYGGDHIVIGNEMVKLASIQLYWVKILLKTVQGGSI
ncbi:hypothetical protein QVD17_08669 [Tagetes erecta]|uniref:Uncharacterized protein n=1 Tax=Tagetes erecta TaxID=13708 RepID=A0AAD8KZP4_TARER|nr:hypothetical protein QVD17_08669 [Tagetes erecta]